MKYALSEVCHLFSISTADESEGGFFPWLEKKTSSYLLPCFHLLNLRNKKTEKSDLVSPQEAILLLRSVKHRASCSNDIHSERTQTDSERMDDRLLFNYEAFIFMFHILVNRIFLLSHLHNICIHYFNSCFYAQWITNEEWATRKTNERPEKQRLRVWG